MMKSQWMKLLEGLRMFRTWVTLLAIVLVVTSGTMVWEAAAQHGSNGQGDNWDDNDQGQDHDSEPYAIGLWGDMPYSDVQAKDGVPNLIMDMNRQKLAFT